MNSEPQPFVWPGGANSSATNSPAVDAEEAMAAQLQQGFERGYADGYAKAQAEVNARAEQQLVALGDVTQRATEFYRRWQLAQVELIQLLTTKLLGQALATQPGALEHLIAQGQQRLPNLSDPIVACHPDRLDNLPAALSVQFVGDKSLPQDVLELREGASAVRLDIAKVVAEVFENWPLDVDAGEERRGEETRCEEADTV